MRLPKKGSHLHLDLILENLIFQIRKFTEHQLLEPDLEVPKPTDQR